MLKYVSRSARFPHTLTAPKFKNANRPKRYRPALDTLHSAVDNIIALLESLKTVGEDDPEVRFF